MSLPDFAGIGSLALLSNAETRSISAENPDGSRGGGAKADPEPGNPASNLGRGWKVRPCITLKAGTTTTLADIEGPGTIQHIWITVTDKFYRDGVLRMYWDNENSPSVECPLADFFANGHGLRYDVNSFMVCVNPNGGFNCYWPMPFRKHCRITIENQHTEDIGGFFYQVTYQLAAVPDDAAYFHAQYRSTLTTREHPEHTIVEGIRGAGHYVGTHLSWTQMSNGWWGEGEIKFFLDGDKEYPTICGTGTEDYVGGAWCFQDRTYSTPFLGYTLCRQESKEVPRHAMYRWHVLDPIRFKQDLRVTIQALGWWPNRKFQPLTDQLDSVAYWYQREPHVEFESLAEAQYRWAR